MGNTKEKQESINVDIRLSKTQTNAWEYLTDNVTTEVVFGGGVAGGKTFLLALWVCAMSVQYPDTRWLVARTVLQQMKLTTMKTIFEVLQIMGLKSGEHYTFNGQNNVITFYNKSEIIFKDIQFNPSDSNFDSLGSLEITGCAIDEAAQATRTAYSVLKSRIRYRLTEYGLKPKILMTTNPGTNFIKTDFYDLYMKDQLPPTKKFIQSLITDNSNISQDYIDNLRTLPMIQQRRLLQGDWNFSEDEDNVFDYESITSSIFRNDMDINGVKYMSCDIARLGADKTVIVIWVGLTIIDIKIYEKLDTVQVSNYIKE